MSKEKNPELKTIDQITEEDRFEIAKVYMDHKFEVDKYKDWGAFAAIIGTFGSAIFSYFCFSFFGGDIFRIITSTVPFDFFALGLGFGGFGVCFKTARSIENACCKQLGFLDVKTLRQVVKSKEFQKYINTYKKYHPELLSKKERKAYKQEERYLEENYFSENELFDEYDAGYKDNEIKKTDEKIRDKE